MAKKPIKVTEVVLRDVAEFLLVILAERLRQEAIDLVGHEQHIVALLAEQLHCELVVAPRDEMTEPIALGNKGAFSCCPSA